MEETHGSLIHLGAGRPISTHSGPESNHSRNSGTDAAMGRLSLDSTQTGLDQGPGQKSSSKGFSSKSIGTSGLTDEAILQALAQA